MMLEKLCEGLKMEGWSQLKYVKEMTSYMEPKVKAKNYNNLLLEVKKNVKAKAWEIRILQIHIGSQQHYLTSSL